VDQFLGEHLDVEKSIEFLDPNLQRSNSVPETEIAGVRKSCRRISILYDILRNFADGRKPVDFTKAEIPSIR
jgi:hypothetical protein